ncbi:MAG: hypothetical protein LBH43_17330 [Treponema sp.]|jgi:hypothetical protein|nr:hypothetical protein [Treponema sp.]
MARKTKITAEMYETLAASMFACFEAIVDDLHETGVVDKWKVEKKAKQAERLRKKTAQKLREQKIMDECVEEYCKTRKSA